MADIEELLETDDETLLLMLAEDLKGDSLALDLRDTKQKIADARAWVSENTVKLRNIVCSSTVVKKELAQKEVLTRKELVAAIADAILLAFAIPTPSLIAVIIYRSGIHNFCEKHVENAE